MRYKAYIFDLDGTLLDTLDDLTDAVNAALSAYGCPVRSREEVRSFVGNGIKMLLIRAVLEGESHPHFEEIFRAFKEYYAAHCEDKTKPYDGVTELLQKIKREGAKAAIVSNKADFATKKLAERYFKGLVDVALGENEAAGIRKKPAPDSVEAALKAMKIAAADAVYIGDSEVDIETAKNAALPCLSVCWGFKSEEFLIDHAAEKLIHSPEEIL